jgi:hypothetical protein
MYKIPNPGSIEAVKLGCTCPVMDNEYGEGIDMGIGENVFWISSDCPIHSKDTNDTTRED